MGRGADVEFNAQFKRYFRAERGAYSVVTAREGSKDRQITLTGVENDIAVRHFGIASLNRFRGSVKALEAQGIDPKREFRRFPTGERVYPKVNFPKMDKNELRLYFADDEFRVYAGDFWGIFVRDGEIWICSFSRQIKAQIETGDLADGSRAATLEPEEDNFQDLANGAPPGQVLTQITRWDRDPSLASRAFVRSNYKCELFPDIMTFLSKNSGKPFHEAHHLIPMREQAQFRHSLDTLDNICVLSPFGHRMLHHASFDLVVPEVKKLISKRAGLLKFHGLLEDDIIGLYR